MPARLGVNVNHVATLRQLRRCVYPDPVAAAIQAEMAGADQITIHLREDRRHIQDRDLQVMRKTVTTRLNLEMAATQEMVRIAYEAKPDMVTLVPERREELTTEGGLDVVGGREAVRKAVKTLRDADIEVSLFIDPELDQVKAAHRAEATIVEFHTGRYCDARLAQDRRRELNRLVDACKAAANRADRGRRPRSQLPERAARGRHLGDGGAEHRPLHRRPRGHGRLRASGARDEGPSAAGELVARTGMSP